jgi:hypothetical protein
MVRAPVDESDSLNVCCCQTIHFTIPKVIPFVPRAFPVPFLVFVLRCHLGQIVPAHCLMEMKETGAPWLEVQLAGQKILVVGDIQPHELETARHGVALAVSSWDAV